MHATEIRATAETAAAQSTAAQSTAALIDSSSRPRGRPNRAAAIEFNQLHARCGHRIQYHKTCPVHGKVEAADIVRGFCYAPDHYLEIEPAKLDKLRPVKDKALDLEHAVHDAIEERRGRGGSPRYAPRREAIFISIVAITGRNKRRGSSGDTPVVRHAPDDGQYHHPSEGQLKHMRGSKVGRFFVVPASRKDGESTGFDSNVASVVHVDPDAPDGGAVVDLRNVSPQDVDRAIASSNCPEEAFYRLGTRPIASQMPQESPFEERTNPLMPSAYVVPPSAVDGRQVYPQTNQEPIVNDFSPPLMAPPPLPSNLGLQPVTVPQMQVPQPAMRKSRNPQAAQAV
ncbi:MAG: hypothetical protein HY040_04620 [Planctomycetes bacterium]|nr:hypothetical protein [Planctomycetota bacterium]